MKHLAVFALLILSACATRDPETEGGIIETTDESAPFPGGGGP